MMHPPIILAKQKGFTGEVKATNLSKDMVKFEDVVMMSKEES
jgi:ribosomal protein L24